MQSRSRLYLGAATAPAIISVTRQYARMQNMPLPNVTAGGSALPAFSNFTLSQLYQQFGVVFNQWESSRGDIYDSFSYPAAGLAQPQVLFQVPIGAGAGFGGGNKTASDTNMQNNGVLPQNVMFLVQSISIDVQPTTPTGGAGADLPASKGAVALNNLVNDVYIIRRSGNFKLTVGSKDYCQEAPLAQFPPLGRLHVTGAYSDSTTPAAAQQTKAIFAEVQGSPYLLGDDSIMIPPMTNFGCTVWWPEGAQVIANPARIFVHLNGKLLRKIQ